MIGCFGLIVNEVGVGGVLKRLLFVFLGFVIRKCVICQVKVVLLILCGFVISYLWCKWFVLKIFRNLCFVVFCLKIIVVLCG